MFNSSDSRLNPLSTPEDKAILLKVYGFSGVYRNELSTTVDTAVARVEGTVAKNPKLHLARPLLSISSATNRLFSEEDMNLGGQRAERARGRKVGSAEPQVKPAVDEGNESTRLHERELRYIAAFRLRDAANRVATLVGMSRSADLRAELLAIYDRLMAEEHDLLVRTMDIVDFKSSATAGLASK